MKTLTKKSSKNVSVNKHPNNYFRFSKPLKTQRIRLPTSPATSKRNLINLRLPTRWLRWHLNERTASNLSNPNKSRTRIKKKPIKKLRNHLPMLSICNKPLPNNGNRHGPRQPMVWQVLFTSHCSQLHNPSNGQRGCLNYSAKWPHRLHIFRPL
jgi:hypothetical protein